jgi:hypothetical protein
MHCGKSHPCFRGAYCLHFQGQKKVKQATGKKQAGSKHSKTTDTTLPTQQQQKSTNKGSSIQEQNINTHGTPAAKLHWIPASQYSFPKVEKVKNFNYYPCQLKTFYFNQF